MQRSTQRELLRPRPMPAMTGMVVLAIAFGAGCRSQSAQSDNVPASPSLRAHNTELARSQNDRAFQLIRQAKYAEAEPLLRQSLEADPSFGPALNNLGLVHYKLDRFYDAAWEFESATRLMPQQPEPRNNLGLVLEHAGKLDAATAAYEKAHTMRPENAEYLGNLVRVRVRSGNFEEPTRAMLEQVVLRDSRPEWQAWARLTLLRIRGPATEPAPPSPPRSGDQ